MNSPVLVYDYFESPVGSLLVAGDGDYLQYVSFPAGKTTRKPDAHWQRDGSAFKPVYEQLSAYFAGELTRFDLPLHYAGTPFQNSVWTALRDIPFGTTWSYGQLAARIGNPGASRPVGAANGANPIPIIIPCHRVIGSDNSLTGFGGGVKTKQFLLEHEGVIEAQPLLI